MPVHLNPFAPLRLYRSPPRQADLTKQKEQIISLQAQLDVARQSMKELEETSKGAARMVNAKLLLFF